MPRAHYQNPTQHRDGDVRLVKKFLQMERGRYALELDDAGYSPLMRAAQRGSLEIVRG